MKPMLASFLEERIHSGHIFRTRRGSDLGFYRRHRRLACLIFCGGAGNAKKEGNERKQEKRLHPPIILRFWDTARTGVSEILTKMLPTGLTIAFLSENRRDPRRRPSPVRPVAQSPSRGRKTNASPRRRAEDHSPPQRYSFMKS
jgi:hypothetical protein